MGHFWAGILYNPCTGLLIETHNWNKILKVLILRDITGNLFETRQNMLINAYYLENDAPIAMFVFLFLFLFSERHECDNNKK